VAPYELVLHPGDGGWGLHRDAKRVGQITLRPAWRLEWGDQAWDVQPFGSGWRWAATRSGSDEPEAWLDGGDRAVRGAAVILGSGDELLIRGKLLGSVRWRLRGENDHVLMAIRPQKDDRSAVDVLDEVEPLLLLITCLFSLVQRLEPPAIGGGLADGG
jgi:hypothetical protein